MADRRESAETIIVGISGPSSSGKTTLARLLRSVFSGNRGGRSSGTASKEKDDVKTFIIHEDDFYYSDDKIPYTTTRSGQTVQDWDTIGAIDVSFLASALAYVRSHGSLPPRLKSKEDRNEATDSGVPEAIISKLQDKVDSELRHVLGGRNRRVETGASAGASLESFTLAFMEGFLLYAPPNKPAHPLSAVQRQIHLPLFLPATYSLVKARREGRSGYVTVGPAPTPERKEEEGEKGTEIDLEEEVEEPPQNFWTDPPGYVDDIVWPRYVEDHAWLLLPEADVDSGNGDSRRLIELAGEAGDIRPDVGVQVAPGKGEAPMAEVLEWAVDEVLRCVSAYRSKPT